MNESSDPQLLREFSSHRSESAFTELVRRHIDFVHSTARRLTNDPHLAKDVSQGVFVAMAKEAGNLVKHPVVTGWLHRTTRNIAAQCIRTEVRRRNREKEAATMHAHPDADSTWDEVSPVLDAALADLAGPDRDAVLLRYFENKSAHEMATLLGISTEAAQKRVSRAVERLRENLARRGITAGTAGLASVISTHAVQAAPVGLAASVSSAALVAVSASPFVLTNFLLKFALGTAAVATLFTAIHQTSRVSDLRAENQNLQRQIASHTAVESETDAFFIPAASAEHDNAGATVGGNGGAGGGFMVGASIGGPSAPSEFSLFAPAGRGITTGAAEIARLDEEERRAVDKILRAAWKRLEDDFASRAVETEASSPEIKAYSIPGRSDGGSGPRRQLEAELDAAVGPAKRDVLMSGIRTGDLFGNFGELDFTIEFGKSGCSFRMTDPKSVENVGSGSMNYESFIKRFGHSFETPEPEGPSLYR